MRHVGSWAGPLLVLSALAASGPARAELKALSDKTVAGWRIQRFEDPSEGKPKWCLITSPPQDGTAVGVAVGQKLPLHRGKTAVSLSLYNGSWDLGPTSAGTVIFEVDKVPQSFVFHRISGNQMQSNLETDDPAIMKWAETLFANGLAMSVRLPNSEAFTVQEVAGEASAEAQACLEPVTAPPPPPRDPFAKPSPESSKDSSGKR